MDNTFFVGRQITHPSIVLTNGNFDFREGKEGQQATDYGLLEDVGTYRLEDVGEEPAKSNSGERPQVQTNYIPIDPARLSEQCRYGSLELYLRSMVTELILHFPGALVADRQSGALHTAIGYWHNSLSDESYIEVPESAIINPFQVNYLAQDTSADRSGWQDFHTYWTHYDILNLDTGQRHAVVGYQAPGSQDFYLKLLVQGQLFIDDHERRNETLFILPSQVYYQSFLDNLHPLQRHMLSNNGVFRLVVPEEGGGGERLFSWPQRDFYHPDIESQAFRVFFGELLALGRDYDQFYGDTLFRRYLPGSLQEQDYSDAGKVKSLSHILGRSLDELRTRISGLRRMSRYDYPLPHSLQKQRLSSDGWQVQPIMESEEGDQKFWQMLYQNQAYLTATKGTRRGLEDLLNLFGLIPGLVTINEYVYKVQNPVTYQDEGYYFQQYGDQDGGDAYLRIVIGDQDITQITDAQKSGTDEQPASLINTKLLDYTIHRDNIIAFFTQAMDGCDKDDLAKFTDLVDEQVERFRRLYFPFLRDHFMPATTITGGSSILSLHVEYNMFTATPGASNGGVRINVQGGTGPYEYEWEDGFISQENERYGLPAGQYVVWVRDAGTPRLSRRFEFEILEAEDLCLSWRVREDSAYCVTEQLVSGLHLDGIFITDPGQGPDCPATLLVRTLGEPYGDINYEWTDAFGQVVGDTAVISLPLSHQDQVFRVVVWDDLRSKGHLSEEVTLPGNPIIVETDSTMPGFNTSDGAIQANTSGGSGNYTYHWTGPDNFTADTALIDNLPPGIYGLTVSDDCGNQTTISVDLADPCAGAEPIAVTVTTQQASYGAADAAISLTVSGGSGAYSFEWSGPDGYMSQQKDISGLVPGAYTISIVDECGLVYEETITVNEEDPCLTAAPINVGDVSVKNIDQGDLTSGYNPDIEYTRINDTGTVVYFDIEASLPVPADQDIMINVEVSAEYVTNSGSRSEETETFRVVIRKGSRNGVNTFGDIDWFSGSFQRLTTKSVRVYGNVAGYVQINPSDVSGGVPPYSYSWTLNGQEVAQTLNLEDVMQAGWYRLTITDTCGQTFSEDYYINEI